MFQSQQAKGLMPFLILGFCWGIGKRLPTLFCNQYRDTTSDVSAKSAVACRLGN